MLLLRRRVVRLRLALALAALAILAGIVPLLVGCQETEKRLIVPTFIRGEWVKGFLEFQLMRSEARNNLTLSFAARNHTWYQRFTRFQVNLWRADGQGGWRVIEYRPGEGGDGNFSCSATREIPWGVAVEIEIRVWLDDAPLRVERLRLDADKVGYAGTILLHFEDSPTEKSKNPARAPLPGESPEPTPTVPPAVGTSRHAAIPGATGAPGLLRATEPPAPVGP